MKNEKNSYQSKLDYWLAQHSNLMNTLEYAMTNDTPIDEPCFMDKLEEIKQACIDALNDPYN